MLNIGGIRSIISYDVCAQLIHSLVTVRLDYSYYILYGFLITVCIVYRKFKTLLQEFWVVYLDFPHISATLFDLYWLPIRYRITFKV